jgi:hypothetical protein
MLSRERHKLRPSRRIGFFGHFGLAAVSLRARVSPHACAEAHRPQSRSLPLCPQARLSTRHCVNTGPAKSKRKACPAVCRSSQSAEAIRWKACNGETQSRASAHPDSQYLVGFQ